MQQISPSQEFLGFGYLELINIAKELVKSTDDFLITNPFANYKVPQDFGKIPKNKAVMRHIFMNTRDLAFDAVVLAESLHKQNHYNSPSMAYCCRSLFEFAIDIAYIFHDMYSRNHSDKSVERYYGFLRSVNNAELRKKFCEKYSDTRRGDYWSGKSREEKMELGLRLGLKMRGWTDETSPGIFDELNEEVHNNIGLHTHYVYDRNMEDYIDLQAGKSMLYVNQCLYTASEYYYTFSGKHSELDNLDEHRIALEKMLYFGLEGY